MFKIFSYILINKVTSLSCCFIINTLKNTFSIIVARGKCPLGTIRSGASMLRVKMSWKMESNTLSSVDQQRIDGGQMPAPT